ncbi:CopG protein [hydrothermal vent metagenome]|uniref:CopG protein n=1 Tax=hydrothermal vent metagenome TaxID=652676 RepID=A0A3B0ZK22_9ZZZZ
MKLHIYLLAALVPLLAACDSTPSSSSAEKSANSKTNVSPTASKVATTKPPAASSTASGAPTATAKPAASSTTSATPAPTAKPAAVSPAPAPTAPAITPSATTLAATAPATAAKAPTTASASTTNPVITVYKSATCSCCSRWVTHLKANGFTVKAINVPNVIPYKQKAGVTPQLASCHTAFVNGYVVEGHVPASEIKQMLKQKPAIKGISVPAMPHGTPGMDVSGRKDPYDVVSFDKNGQVKVYKSYR